MRGCGNDPVSFCFQFLNTIECVVPCIPVFMKTQPFWGTHGNILIDCISMLILYDVDILDPEDVAGPQNGACIVWLIEIFQRNGDVSCTKIQYLLEFFFSGIR